MVVKTTKIGIFSAVMASACCIGPIALSVLGLGSLGFGSMLGKYHWHLQGGSLAVLVLAWGIFLREKKRMYALASEMRNEGLTKAILRVATLVVLFFFGLNFYSASAIYSLPEMPGRMVQERIPGEALAGEMVTLRVEGMTCLTCELSVESALKKLEGVVSSEAQAAKKSVTIRYDPKQVTLKNMIEAINSTGYKASPPADLRLK